MPARIAIDHDKLDAFCRKWRIKELALFGSVLRDDFASGSDIDVLVSFEASATWSLWDHNAMERELADVFGRNVDVLTRRSVERSENWIRRKSILQSAENIYER